MCVLSRWALSRGCVWADKCIRKCLSFGLICMWVWHPVHVQAESRGRKPTQTRPNWLSLNRTAAPGTSIRRSNSGLVLLEVSGRRRWTLLSGTRGDFPSLPLIGWEAAVAQSAVPAIAAAAFKPRPIRVKLGGIRRTGPLLTIFSSAWQLMAEKQNGLEQPGRGLFPSEKHCLFHFIQW